MVSHGLPRLTLEGQLNPQPLADSATDSHPHHCSLGPTTLEAMYYWTAVQLPTPENRRRPDRCHCAWLRSSKDSIWAEETRLIRAVTSETGTEVQKRGLHTHELMKSVHVARSSWNADGMALVPMLTEIVQQPAPSQTSKVASARLLRLLVLALEYTTNIDAHMSLYIPLHPLPFRPGELTVPFSNHTHHAHKSMPLHKHCSLVAPRFLLSLSRATGTAIPRRFFFSPSSLSIVPFPKIHQLQWKINGSIKG